MYEDGSHAIWVPGTERKEKFTLKRYKEEIGKDYKRITMFLCTDCEFKLAQDISDKESNDDESLGKPQKYCKFDSHPGFDCCSDSSELMAHSLPSTSTPAPVMVDLMDTHDQAAKHNEKSAEQDIQTKHDAQLAEQLQEFYDQVDNDLNSNQETHELGFADKISVVRAISKNVDQSGELFIVIRRGSPIGRILSIWKREMKSTSCQSAYPWRTRY